MYRKSSKGWLKHFDFILIDLISLHLAFVLSYVCRHGIGNPYKNLLYRNMAFMLTFIDFFVVFLFETLKGVLRRGYYQELAATVKHVILVMLLAVLYLFTIQEGTSFSSCVLYNICICDKDFVEETFAEKNGKWRRPFISDYYKQ